MAVWGSYWLNINFPQLLEKNHNCFPSDVPTRQALLIKRTSPLKLRAQKERSLAPRPYQDCGGGAPTGVPLLPSPGVCRMMNRKKYQSACLVPSVGKNRGRQILLIFWCWRRGKMSGQLGYSSTQPNKVCCSDRKKMVSSLCFLFRRYQKKGGFCLVSLPFYFECSCQQTLNISKDWFWELGSFRFCS